MSTLLIKIHWFGSTAFRVMALPLNQGDQNGFFQWKFGFFWKVIVMFWMDEVAQRNGSILSYFLLKKFLFYIFTFISCLKVFKVVWCKRFVLSKLSIFGNCLGYFSLNLAEFLPHLVTLVIIQSVVAAYFI